MLVRQISKNAKTGEVLELEIDIPDVVTEEVAVKIEQQEKDKEYNEKIYQQLQMNDVGIIRALIENDTVRIEAHKISQEELRKTLKILESSKDVQ